MFFFFIEKIFSEEEQEEYDRLTAPVDLFAESQKQKQKEKLPRYEAFCEKWGYVFFFLHLN